MRTILHIIPPYGSRGFFLTHARISARWRAQREAEGRVRALNLGDRVSDGLALREPGI
jgi:hypothetical protein